MTHQIGKPIFNLICTACLLLLSHTAIAQLSVTVDRNQLTEADALKLTIVLNNISSSTSPDFSLLERDFEIISRSGPNQSRRISFVNGQQTAEMSVSWELRLRARRLGQIVIPSFQFAGEQSAPITINVVAQTAAMRRKTDQLVFFETRVDKPESYVQGQVIYTCLLYTSPSPRDS